jgi:hypothetical protein
MVCLSNSSSKEIRIDDGQVVQKKPVPVVFVMYSDPRLLFRLKLFPFIH